MPIYDEKYITVKRKEFNGVVNTHFLDNGVPKEGAHYACIACISIGSIMEMEKRNYPQVYLEGYKFKKMLRVTDVELESHSSSDCEWL